MSTKTSKLSALVALTLAAVLLAPTQVAAAEYYLKASAFDMPDPNGGADIRMWGYSTCGAGFANCSAPSVPGPVLSVPVGDSVLLVHLNNSLAVPTSLVVNGLSKAMSPVFSTDAQGRRRVRSFDAEAAAGGTQDYNWPNVQPGTYLYQSGTQPQVQVQMGLYGALAKNAVEALPTAPAQAYAGVTYDSQATLIFSEIDTALHAAIAAGTYGVPCPVTEPDCGNITSTFNYVPSYFLINGKPYQVGAPVIEPVAGLNTPQGNVSLLRVLNAGLTTHVPMVQGAYWDIVAEDGKPYPFKAKQYTALLPAAKTLDLILTRTPGVTYAIMDRRLGLSNSGQANGGMLAFLGSGAVAGGGLGGGSGGGTNVPPVAMADNFASVPGAMVHQAAPGLLANDDITDGPALAAVAITNGLTACGGTFTLLANGAFTYRPPTALLTIPSGCNISASDANNPSTFVGSDSFSYQATDGGAMSAPATVTITASTPTAPVLTVLDSFDTDGSTLGTNWNQAVTSTQTTPDIQVIGTAAKVISTTLGGLAIFDPTMPDVQAAGFTNATPLTNSALILKATGGLPAAPANAVRVRCESPGTGGELVVATMLGGSNTSTYVRQAGFANGLCAGGSGALSAVVDAKGLVTTFIDGVYVGGVQLPDLGAWKGTGKIGIQLQTPDASVDNFSGTP